MNKPKKKMKKYSEKEREQEVRKEMEFFQCRSTSIQVIYRPDCGCKIDQFVLLDRFPMSPGIISLCPACKKGCIMEISQPILFHDPLTDKDFRVEDLKNGVISDTWQKHLLVRYSQIDILSTTPIL